jgi:hypothetical protein
MGSFITGQLVWLTPEGEKEDLYDARFSTDPEHLWIYGKYPAATPEQREVLKNMLLEEQSAFAYT